MIENLPVQWDDIKYFSPDEDWGDVSKMDGFFLYTLDMLREQVGKPFIVHCGYGSDGHVPNSLHKVGKAVDFHIVGIGLYTAWEQLDRLWWLGGLGIYPHWNSPGFHLDAGECRRWMRNSDGKYTKVKHGVLV